MIDRCLTFKYLMNRPGVGKLIVKTGDAYGLDKIVWSKHNYGPTWRKAAIFLPADPGLNIFIEGIAGRSRTHYIAMDDFILRPGRCV